MVRSKAAADRLELVSAEGVTAGEIMVVTKQGNALILNTTDQRVWQHSWRLLSGVSQALRTPISARWRQHLRALPLVS